MMDRLDWKDLPFSFWGEQTLEDRLGFDGFHMFLGFLMSFTAYNSPLLPLPSSLIGLASSFSASFPLMI